MIEVAMVANLIFLILMIIFAIKMRADFQELKKQILEKDKNKEGKDAGKISDLKEKIEQIEMKTISHEERITSLEFDTKEIRERIGQLSQISSENKEKINLMEKVLASSKIKQNENENEKEKYVEKEHMGKKEKDAEADNLKKLDMVLKYAQEGKTEEEIAKFTGLSYEEVKLILKIKNK
jgi:small-conductance mechanosensitive channel